ncbi:MAG TPA: diacylglycerol kinase family protein [Syntrophobacteria bacterium]|nr:diacylglycerol kinase family protein [Syntrophobacteria bacterium]
MSGIPAADLRRQPPVVGPRWQRKRVGVLSNPLSGGNRKGLRAVREILSGHPEPCHREVQTPGDVASALADFSHREVEVVAVNGGDGTIQAVLTALFHRRPFERLPLLAIVRAGTDSVIAGDVGLRGSRERGLGKLVRWARGGDGGGVLLQRPVLRVQAARHAEPLYGMSFGAGAVYQGILFCRHRVHTLGLRGGVAPGLTLLRFLLAAVCGTRHRVTPVPMLIGLDGQPPEHLDCLVVFASTLERLFLGLRPFWGTEEGPVHFTAVTSKPAHLLRALPFLLRGRGGPHGTRENGYLSHNVRDVRLSFDGGYTLDGELYRPDPQHGPIGVRHGGQVSFLQL